MPNPHHDRKGKFSSKSKGETPTPVNAENVQEYIPADSKKLVFPVDGGRVVPERGVKYGKGTLEWKSSLKWALQNYQTSSIERAAALRAIALTVVDKAVRGDKDAVSEIANRLDGKAIQQMEVRSEEDTRITIIHRME